MKGSALLNSILHFADKRLTQRSSIYHYIKQRGIRVLISREGMKVLFGVMLTAYTRGIGYIRHSLDTHSYMTVVISYRGGRNVRN